MNDKFLEAFNDLYIAMEKYSSILEDTIVDALANNEPISNYSKLKDDATKFSKSLEKSKTDLGIVTQEGLKQRPVFLFGEYHTDGVSTGIIKDISECEIERHDAVANNVNTDHSRQNVYNFGSPILGTCCIGKENSNGTFTIFAGSLLATEMTSKYITKDMKVMFAWLKSEIYGLVQIVKSDKGVNVYKFTRDYTVKGIFTAMCMTYGSYEHDMTCATLYNEPTVSYADIHSNNTSNDVQKQTDKQVQSEQTDVNKTTKKMLKTAEPISDIFVMIEDGNIVARGRFVGDGEFTLFSGSIICTTFGKEANKKTIETFNKLKQLRNYQVEHGKYRLTSPFTVNSIENATELCRGLSFMALKAWYRESDNKLLEEIVNEIA